MALEFAEIVTQLVQPVRVDRVLKRGQDGLVDLLGGPAAERVAAVQENLQQTNEPSVVDFDSRGSGPNRW